MGTGIATPLPARRAAAIALATYVLVLAFVLLNPLGQVPTSAASWTSDAAERLGAPGWVVDEYRWDFGCNVLILVPLSALGSVIWPRSTWQSWTAYGFLVSAAVELVQGPLLPQRSATFADIVANTLGCLVGAAVVTLTGRLAQRRSAS